MKVAMHDNEVDNSLVTKPRFVGSDSEAEWYVRTMAVDDRAANVIKWILTDRRGVVCVWERLVGSTALPEITQRSARYTGKWGQGPSEVAIP